MKKDYQRHIITLFFITLFCLKGAVLVLPLLFTQLKQVSSIETINDLETEDAEKKPKTNLIEYFVPHTSHHNITTYVLHIATTQKITQNNILSKENISLPVSTPPPELT